MTTPPELATAPEITRTGESLRRTGTRTAPQPRRILDELALLDDVRPATYCRRCGCAGERQPWMCSPARALPETYERWLDQAITRALVGAGLLGENEPVEHRRAARADRNPLIRALGEALIADAG